MKGFEGQPAPAPRPEREESLVGIEDNQVQVELIELWAEHQSEEFADNNAMSMGWISSGLAAAFREYVENNPGEKVELDNKAALAELLSQLGTLSEH